jgi:hypothetical protein
MTFQLSLSNGARWRLIETNGVLFEVHNFRAQQKRHRPYPDKTSGLSTDTALTLISTKTNTKIPDEQAKEQRKRKQSDHNH